MQNKSEIKTDLTKSSAVTIRNIASLFVTSEWKHASNKMAAIPYINTVGVIRRRQELARLKSLLLLFQESLRPCYRKRRQPVSPEGSRHLIGRRLPRLVLGELPVIYFIPRRILFVRSFASLILKRRALLLIFVSRFIAQIST